MIRTIIIDDEENSISTLIILIRKYCPEVEIVDKCQSSASALLSIQTNQPDLLFLDIEMPVTSGFEILHQIKDYRGSVIFITAHNQYAIQAIKHSALDYLLKPVDPKELIIAIQRLIRQRNPNVPEQIQFLMDLFSNKEYASKKIAIPNIEGFKLRSIDDIIFCEADDNYTEIHLKNNGKLIASRTLKDIQQLLAYGKDFIRVHHSYLININEVSQYVRGDGGYLIMSNGKHVRISKDRRESILRRIIK